MAGSLRVDRERRLSLPAEARFERHASEGWRARQGSNFCRQGEAEPTNEHRRVRTCGLWLRRPAFGGKVKCAKFLMISRHSER
jgi:hypothetical protein